MVRLLDEIDVVRVAETALLDYVRVLEVRLPTRTRLPRLSAVPGRLLGYSVLAPYAANGGRQPGMFWRRAFWVAARDRDSAPTGVCRQGCPAEPVDSATVGAGAAGHVTERARRGRSDGC